ncbi:putative alkaline shock family protein YloU [Caldalkalibacillus uzonensis]|uniref:Alkaline shock family protein YloU n=1 Tax=Caldalkalibacillus uzonensis TaxID=353224 RepID=A0ABU0CV59_9BACI|nr:Asp23/Gls24 family envelope stress response protein [Caldalkalibacillus uzonensis]MDQ0340312.1 putative alkaline shock family protein YloU [Caldalkalibacillus uzonensis]
MEETKDKGVVRIADDVVAVIASIATLDTEGITSMSGGIVEGFARRVSGKQVHKGVQVNINNNEAAIHLRVIVQYGQKIDDVCRNVQRNVKEAVENMTGLYVNEVNVRVEGVDFAKPSEQQENQES